MTSNILNPAAWPTTPAPRAAAVGAVLAAFWNLVRAPIGTALPRLRSRLEASNSVRRMADRLRLSDPGFAADLYAAADRHDQIDESTT